MEIKDPILGRIIGANVVAWIGAIIGAEVAPEFGGDAFSSIVSALNVMIGVFLGALFGGGVGWFIDRLIGNNRRESYDYPPPRLDNRTGPRPGESVNSGGRPNRNDSPGPHPVATAGSSGSPNRSNHPGPSPSEPAGGRPIRLTRPGTVSAVTAVHNGDTIAVSWTEVESAAGYDVRYTTNYSRSWTSAASGHIGTSFVITGARGSETYTIAVRAVNDAGASGWATSAPAAR